MNAPAVIPTFRGCRDGARYHGGMEIGSEKNARRILAIGILFATVGVLALVITLMQPSVRDERERLAEEIFSDVPAEEKSRVLNELSAADGSDEVSEEEKLRVLQALSER